MAAEKVTTCRWEEDAEGGWRTACINGRFDALEYRWCPYCGKPIEEVEYVAPDDDEPDDAIG
jgi:hypothetical protein